MSKVFAIMRYQTDDGEEQLYGSAVYADPEIAEDVANRANEYQISNFIDSLMRYRVIVLSVIDHKG